MKEAVSIPVIGNGDILCAQDVIRMKEQTGCDGFMIGRGAQGNPWIFQQILHQLETGEEMPRPSRQEVVDMMQKQHQKDVATSDATAPAKTSEEYKPKSTRFKVVSPKDNISPQQVHQNDLSPCVGFAGCI